MRTPEDADQVPTGLGRKVETQRPKIDPANHWKYIGKNIWRNGSGQLSNAPPLPAPKPPEPLPVPDVIFRPEWYSVIHPELDIDLT